MPIFKVYEGPLLPKPRVRDVPLSQVQKVKIGKGSPPAWAIALLDHILVQEKYPGQITLTWMRKRWGWGARGLSSKRYGISHIHVTQYPDPKGEHDWAYVLIHEATHHLVEWNHTRKFWQGNFKLVDKYGYLAERFGGVNVIAEDAERRAIRYKPRTAGRVVLARRQKRAAMEGES